MYVNGNCYGAKTLAELVAEGKRRTLKPVLPYLAWEGRVTLFAACEKGGKSTLLSAAVVAALEGQPFLDEPTNGISEERPVLWVAREEHPDDIIARFEQMGVNTAQEKRIVVLQHLTDRSRGLKAAVADYNPALVIIDTLSAFASDRITEGGQAAQWQPIMDEFTEIARQHNAAILLVHHLNASGTAYRDSTALGGAVDVILEMRGTGGGGTTQREITYDGRLPGRHARKIVVDYDPETCAYNLLEGGKPTVRLAYEYIVANPADGKTAVRSGVPRNAGDVDAALDVLLTAEPPLIENRGNGSAHAYYSTRPNTTYPSTLWDILDKKCKDVRASRTWTRSKDQKTIAPQGIPSTMSEGFTNTSVFGTSSKSSDGMSETVSENASRTWQVPNGSRPLFTIPKSAIRSLRQGPGRRPEAGTRRGK